MTKAATATSTRTPKASTPKRRFARALQGEGAPQTGAGKGTPTSPASATAAHQPLAPKPPSKTDQVIALLKREQGATLAEMIEETGWLPHSTRAALTGLKKKGHVLEKSKREDVTCYRIVDPA